MWLSIHTLSVNVMYNVQQHTTSVSCIYLYPVSVDNCTWWPVLKNAQLVYFFQICTHIFSSINNDFIVECDTLLSHSQALVKEDELMSRLEMLENQLEVYSKVCSLPFCHSLLSLSLSLSLSLLPLHMYPRCDKLGYILAVHVYVHSMHSVSYTNLKLLMRAWLPTTRI